MRTGWMDEDGLDVLERVGWMSTGWMYEDGLDV